MDRMVANFIWQMKGKGWLNNLWGPVWNENTGHIVKEWLRISNGDIEAFDQVWGPSLNGVQRTCTDHILLKLALTKGEMVGGTYGGEN